MRNSEPSSKLFVVSTDRCTQDEFPDPDIATLSFREFEEWPDNFELDPESDGQLGIYHCPECGPKFREGIRIE